MRSRWFFVFSIIFSVFVFLGWLFLRQPVVPTNKFGVFELGKELPMGYRPGDSTVWAPPDDEIPKSNFFVYIAKDDFCILMSCGLPGSIVGALGGYLAGEYRLHPATESEFGFDDEAVRKKYRSAMVIADGKGIIKGIYLNADINDVTEVLRFHPELADFKELKGVKYYGPLKIGELSPVKPGDRSGYRPGMLTHFPYEYIPAGRKFYVYAFQPWRDSARNEYCPFYECLKFGQIDYVLDLGGWFSNDGRSETMIRFGLNPSDGQSGEKSLVVVTDSRGIIAAIHPGKTTDDIPAIMKQLPELADVDKEYGGPSILSRSMRSVFKYRIVNGQKRP